MPDRTKRIISRPALLAHIHAVLARHPHECRNLHIEAIEVHAEPVNGANWSVAPYRRSDGDNDWLYCWEQIGEQIRHLRETYDVET